MMRRGMLCCRKACCRSVVGCEAGQAGRAPHGRRAGRAVPAPRHPRRARTVNQLLQAGERVGGAALLARLAVLVLVQREQRKVVQQPQRQQHVAARRPQVRRRADVKLIRAPVLRARGARRRRAPSADAPSPVEF